MSQNVEDSVKKVQVMDESFIWHIGAGFIIQLHSIPFLHLVI